uniref:Uncharacterized protein n=1 Tax=Phenylobacterium glaciei TaxID=2803784 RepID=A0A974P425_9CAUL|nr:hypothetical protein JKL49_26085 [Phenylobacterium glaciei]
MAPGFRLDGGAESLVFLTTEAGAPRLVYWGPDLGLAIRSRPWRGWRSAPSRTACWMAASG